jgi:trans-2,3-dihydro-3-hydroxyanthranilate isomerase
MPTFPFVTTDVFTTRRFGGNQLAVFPDARGIPEAAMQPIAREFNFSETTFVLPPADAQNTRKVRIFTPAGELQFAGHPTIGTAFALAWTGAVRLSKGDTRVVLEEGVGPVPVRIRSADGQRPDFAALSVAQLPKVGPTPPSASALARALGLHAEDVLTGVMSPEALSCGTPFLFVPLRNRDAVARCRVRVDEFESAMRDYWTKEVFVFCDEPELPGSTHRARMFAPLLGVPEDPATGSACAAFGGYLASRDARRDGTLRWVIEQGFEMGRPSIMELEVDKTDGHVSAVRVGGSSVLVTRGELTLD